MNENSIEPIRMDACGGCGACVGICPVGAIEMGYDEAGFRKPKITGNCISCGKCIRTCPWLTPLDIPAATPLAYAAWHKDPTTRITTTSGGVATAIAERVVSRGGVVFGVSYNKQWEVVHTHVETLEGIQRFKGSKYVESDLGTSFSDAQDFLEAQRMVLFFGTTCTIAGLKRFLGREYSNLITVDLICHGHPSALLFKRYLEEFHHSPPETIVDINMRNKSDSWSVCGIQIIFGDGKKYYRSQFQEDPFLHLFLASLCLRPCCYRCVFTASPRPSDITLGDYWGIQNEHPELYDERGVSAVLAHTTAGKHLLEELDSIALVTSTFDKIANGNCQLRGASTPPEECYIFYKELRRMTYQRFFKKWKSKRLGNIPFIRRCWYKFLYEFGKLRNRFTSR